MIQDVRYGCRVLARSRGFAATAIALLALATGASTAIFSVVDAALLRPQPYPEPDRLVTLSYTAADGRLSTGAAPRAFLDWRDTQQVFDQIVATGGGVLVLTGDGEPEEIRRTRVTGDFFEMLGVQPMLGRVFGREPATRESLIRRLVTPDYLRVLGVSVVRGRALDDRDTAATATVALINEAAARKFFAEEDPIGRRFLFSKASYQIVGVLRDFRHRGLPRAPEPEMFVPLAQSEYFGDGTLVVRIAGSADRVIPLIKSRAFALVPGRPITDIASLEDVARRDAAPRRFNMLVLTIFAGVALAIAAMGIYCVMAYIVGRRTQEVGIRMALGARTDQIRALFMRQGSAIVGLGLVVGMGGAWFLARTIRSFLYEVHVHDPIVFIGAATLLGLVGLIGCWIPARRASRVDPLKALRTL